MPTLRPADRPAQTVSFEYERLVRENCKRGGTHHFLRETRDDGREWRRCPNCGYERLRRPRSRDASWRASDDASPTAVDDTS